MLFLLSCWRGSRDAASAWPCSSRRFSGSHWNLDERASPTLGFPGDLLGYTASGSIVLVQITSVTGIYGLSLLVAAYNASSVWWLRSPSPRSWSRPTSLWFGFPATLLVAVFVGGRFVPSAQPAYWAHLVQTDLPQSMEYPANWDALHAGDMAELDRLSITRRRGNNRGW